MKKILMTLAVLILTGAAANAQAYRNSRYYNQRTGHLDYSLRKNMYERGENYYGLRIGPSFSTVNSDDPCLDGGDSQTGLDIGAVAGIALSDKAPLFLETGLYYTEKGGKKKIENGKKMTYDLNYLEVPITVKYAYPIDENFSIQPFAGGYLACGVGGKIKNYGLREAESSFSSDCFKRFDGGLRVGCGAAYDMFYFDITYDIGRRNRQTLWGGCTDANPKLLLNDT